MQASLLANLGGGTPRTHLQHMQTANTCQHSALRRTRLRGVGPFALVRLHLRCHHAVIQRSVAAYCVR